MRTKAAAVCRRSQFSDQQDRAACRRWFVGSSSSRARRRTPPDPPVPPACARRPRRGRGRAVRSMPMPSAGLNFDRQALGDRSRCALRRSRPKVAEPGHVGPFLSQCRRRVVPGDEHRAGLRRVFEFAGHSPFRSVDLPDPFRPTRAKACRRAGSRGRCPGDTPVSPPQVRADVVEFAEAGAGHGRGCGRDARV